MKSNCLVWTAREFWRLNRQWVVDGRPCGGKPYVFIRSSNLAPGWVPHFGVEQHGTKRSFCTLDPRPLRGFGAIRALWFEGYVKVGDA